MASIIAVSDFTGQNNIPNKDIIGENLQIFIDKYEPMFLKELLGSALYDAVKAELLLEPIPVRTTNLVAEVRPALIDYTYWFYMENEFSQTLGTGEGQTKKQNAQTSSPYSKMVRAWNEMVSYNKNTNKFLNDNKIIYPEYVVILPLWFYVNGFYPVFDWNWYMNFGEYCLPSIYRRKNRLGI